MVLIFMLENDTFYDYFDQEVDYLPFDYSELVGEFLDKYGSHEDELDYEEEYVF